MLSFIKNMFSESKKEKIYKEYYKIFYNLNHKKYILINEKSSPIFVEYIDSLQHENVLFTQLDNDECTISQGKSFLTYKNGKVFFTEKQNKNFQNQRYVVTYNNTYQLYDITCVDSKHKLNVHRDNNSNSITLTCCDNNSSQLATYFHENMYQSHLLSSKPVFEINLNSII